MRISTRGRYALRIMLDIAQNNEGRPVSFRDVSRRQSISVKYMEQIGSILVRGGFLRSVRGSQGGYVLASDPSELMVGDILRATEGSLLSVSCVEEDCGRLDTCLTYPLWSRINRAVADVVDHTSLQDLLDGSIREPPIRIE